MLLSRFLVVDARHSGLWSLFTFALKRVGLRGLCVLVSRCLAMVLSSFIVATVQVWFAVGRKFILAEQVGYPAKAPGQDFWHFSPSVAHTVK